MLMIKPVERLVVVMPGILDGGAATGNGLCRNAIVTNMPITRFISTFCRAALCSAFFLPSMVRAEADRPAHLFADIDLYANGGPVTLGAAQDDWHGGFSQRPAPFAGSSLTDREALDSRVRVGIAWPDGGGAIENPSRREIALFWRYAEALDFSNDAADLYYRTRNGIPLTPGANYALSLDAHRFSALGIAWRQCVLASKRNRVSVTLSGFRAADLLDGHVAGNASVIDADSYTYSVNVDYRYAKDVLFDRPVNAPAGYGASLGVDGSFAFTPQVLLTWRIDDLAGSIRWHDVPATTANAASARTWIDNAGNPVIGPAVSGREFYIRGWTQQIAETGNAILATRINDRYTFAARLDAFITGSDGSLLLSRQFANGSVTGSWYPESRGIGFAFTTDHFGASFAGDATTTNGSHWLRRGLSAR